MRHRVAESAPNKTTVRSVGSAERIARDREVQLTTGRTAREPLFLLGAPRSGTTLLYKTLCLHPGTAWISNWGRRAPSVPDLAVLNRLARRRPATRRRVWFGDDANAYVYGRPRSLVERLFPMPVEGEPLYRRAGVPEAPGSPIAPDAAVRLRRSFGRVTRAQGGSVLVSKRIANNHRVPLLQQAFPEGRFVALVRDGRAVAYSLSRVDWWETSTVWFYGGTPRQWEDEGRDPWELCARTWATEVVDIERGLAPVPDDQVLRLSYESFMRDPRRTLSEVASFAGLGTSAEWDDALDSLEFPDRNERWRTALEPTAIATIEAHQHEQLERYGYVD